MLQNFKLTREEEWQLSKMQFLFFFFFLQSGDQRQGSYGKKIVYLLPLQLKFSSLPILFWPTSLSTFQCCAYHHTLLPIKCKELCDDDNKTVAFSLFSQAALQIHYKRSIPTEVNRWPSFAAIFKLFPPAVNSQCPGDLSTFVKFRVHVLFTSGMEF